MKRARVKSPKVYAVAHGRIRGIFDCWENAKAQIHGFPRAIHKSFATWEEAAQFMTGEESEMESQEATDGLIMTRDRKRQKIVGQEDFNILMSSPPPLPNEQVDLSSSQFALKPAMSATSGPNPPSPMKIDPVNYSFDLDPHISMSTDFSSSPSLTPEESDTATPVPDVHQLNPSLTLLSPEQLSVLQHILKGGNTFFTGPAGSGKSLIVKHLTHALKSPPHRQCAITAPTGVAAMNIDGMTVYSWAGIHRGDKGILEYKRLLQADPSDRELESQQRKRKSAGDIIRQGWLRTDVLVLDEISMVHPDLFQKLNEIGKVARNKPDKPFGGMQVVVSGDFFQLPPVDPDEGRPCFKCGKPVPQVRYRNYLGITDPEVEEKLSDIDHRALGINPRKWLRCNHNIGKSKRPCNWLWNDTIRFAFQTEAWHELGLNDQSNVFILNKVFRQENPEWVDILNKVKLGQVDDHTLAYLKRLKRPVIGNDEDLRMATKLHTHRNPATAENMTEFLKLEGQVYSYGALDSGFRTYESAFGRKVTEGLSQLELQNEFFLRMIQVSENYSLKCGAQVMLLANLDSAGGLANGSRGVISGFVHVNRSAFIELFAPRNNMKPEQPEKSFEFILERHGNAQGAQCNSGQLSAETTSENYCKFVNVEALKAYFQFAQRGGTIPVPVVDFPSTNGIKRVRIPPVLWELTYSRGNEEVTVSRIQVPLCLAWASTIHKCQGMTLDLVSVYLDRVFTAGQAYVGLSRSRSPDNLEIISYASDDELRRVFMVDERVRLFYSRMGMDVGDEL